ncbi:MAG: hypothetical protein AB8F94_24180 [Saprospiraceae bacterium]
MKIIIGILIGISLMFAFQKIMNDKNPTQEQVQATTTQVNSAADIPSDFLVFYTQFHSDSSYQMQHINFPLEGLPEYADSTILAEGNFRWEKEGWQIHKNLDARKEEFVQNLRLVSDGLIFEFIPTGGEKKLWIERRFMKTNGEWRMIYYSGLNFRK